MERHEREAQRRDSDERSPEARDPLPEDDDKPAPPGPANQPRG